MSKFDTRQVWTSIYQNPRGNLRGEAVVIRMDQMEDKWLINSYRAYMIRMNKLRAEAKRRGLDLDAKVLTGTKWLPKPKEKK